MIKAKHMKTFHIIKQIRQLVGKWQIIITYEWKIIAKILSPKIDS